MSLNQNADNHIKIEEKFQRVINQCKDIVSNNNLPSKSYLSTSPAIVKEDVATNENDTHGKVEENIKNVIDECQNIMDTSNSLIRSNPSKIPMTDKDGLTLEKVVRDMTYVLYDLKNGIKLVKSTSKIPSSHNVENELENLYKKLERDKQKRQEVAQKKKVASANKAKSKMSDKKAKVTNGSKPSNQTVIQKGANSSEKSLKNDRNQSKAIITTIKFPTENTKGPRSATSKTTERPRSNPEQALRKSSPKITSERRVMSVPPPREVYNPLGLLKDEVEKAISEEKTFTIRGRFPAVRKSLLKRGWVEKFHINYREKINDEIKRFVQMSLGELVDLLRNKELAPIIKRMVKSKLLKDHQVDLYWDRTFEAFKECPDTKKLTTINRFRRGATSYTSKQGLCVAAKENHWLQIPGVAQINHPRCYVLVKGSDTKCFLQDFGITAATCLLKWVVRNNITGESKIISESGKIPMKTFDFAVTECYKYIKKQKHQDIDEEIGDALEKEWYDFLEQYYKTVHIGNHFKLTSKILHPSQEAKDMVRKANYLLNELRQYMPCLDMDGYMNIWILKPTNSSRGIGIHICRTLEYILEIVKKNPNRRYVIQKYIERPLLIHETKFDIRQWFLISNSHPLTVWIYKQCYLRFSCQTYNLRKLHESIHLTNNSVQAKYMRKGTRDPLLPSFGMWDCKQFRKYLSDIGYPTIFDDTIFPGMKQCITGAMIAHRDKIDRRQNCFEMYGADFMLSEQFEPWLLEINSNPALHASTPVTSKMCPEVLEEVIKVVVDYARNKNANTGNFELIYEERLENHIPNLRANFKVTGTAIPDGYFCDMSTEEEPERSFVISKKFETPDPGRFLLQTGETMKEALKNLLKIVKREKMKRRSRREKAIETTLQGDASSTQTQVVSLYESDMFQESSGYSVKEFNSQLTNQDLLSPNESQKITEVLNGIAALQNKKQLLSSLVKVVDTMANTNTLLNANK